MSRIGRAPIPIPSGVSVSAGKGSVQVKGPKGSLTQHVPTGVTIEIAEGQVRCTRADDRKPSRSRHGLVRALIANMVTGVTSGFAKELEIQGVGYRAEAAGQTLKLSLGFSHPVEMEVPQGLKVSVEKNTLLRIEGTSREAVGQFAAEVRALRVPEPYKGKGIRYVDEHVRRKVGKAGAA